jgi:hypothetical protein
MSIGSLTNAHPEVYSQALTDIFNNANPRKAWGKGIRDENVLEWLIDNVNIVRQKQQNLTPEFKKMFTEIVDDYIKIYQDKITKLQELSTILDPPVLISEFIRSRPPESLKIGAGTKRKRPNNTIRVSKSKKYKRGYRKSKKSKRV